MTVILLTQVTKSTVEVLVPYNQAIEPITGITITPEQRESLTGKLYVLEGAFGDTLDIHLRGDEQTYRFAL
jgi:hypothetical protein